MADQPRISESEWEVMRVLWAASKPLTANQVIAGLKHATEWNPKTIRTLITRLVQKEAIAMDQANSPYTYYPLVAEEEGMRIETDTFLKRISGYALKPIFAQFLSERKLSEQEIEELKRLLDKRGE